jgi:hypothetical protein
MTREYHVPLLAGTVIGNGSTVKLPELMLVTTNLVTTNVVTLDRLNDKPTRITISITVNGGNHSNVLNLGHKMRCPLRNPRSLIIV